MCRVYANVRGLGDVLVRTGIIPDIAVFEDFARGFTRGKALFDFIDVGAGKDRADDKIIGKSPKGSLYGFAYGLALRTASLPHMAISSTY